MSTIKDVTKRKEKDLLLCVHVVTKTLNLETSRFIWQTASKNCTKVRVACAARLFFLIQPIRLLFSGVIVTVAVAVAFVKLPIPGDLVT